jgi:uncharacterized lipoprotein YmbA
MSKRNLVLLLLPLLLAACGSSPKTHYFTLSAAPQPTGARPAIAAPVTVASVNLPASLDRRGMVRRTGSNTVEISDQDRWAAPLDDMTRRVLSRDLAQRLPEGKVVLPDAPSPPHTASIVVAIAQFGADGHGKIVLDGSWSLLKDDKPALHHDVALETTPLGKGADAEAAGMSKLLDQLAAKIAASLAQPT